MIVNRQLLLDILEDVLYDIKEGRIWLNGNESRLVYDTHEKLENNEKDYQSILSESETVQLINTLNDVGQKTKGIIAA